MTIAEKKKSDKKKQAAAKKAAAAKAAKAAAKKAAATSAVVKPGRLSVTLIHNTNGYAKWNHGKGEAATRVTENRYTLDEMVANGTATIADAIAAGDGLHGVARVARQCRAARWIVRGFNPSTDKLSVSTDVRNAMVAELKALKSSTRIVEKTAVPHLCRTR